MALITWTDNLSVSVTEVDEQHKKLVAMINELNEAMTAFMEKRPANFTGT